MVPGTGTRNRWLISLLLTTGCNFAFADEIVLTAAKDNTLYQEATGALSNGAGEYLFAGRVGPTGGGAIRRALVAFDVSTIPAGATVTAASLRLNMSKATSGLLPYSIHKVTADWGEGTSNAEGEEGQGAAATTNDATWTRRFHNSALLWTTAGGDFAATPSATTSVGTSGAYTWASTTTVTDVAGWRTSPATNFGWILIGGEGSDSTAKRFDSSENLLPGNRPQLTVTYTPVTSVHDWVMY